MAIVNINSENCLETNLATAAFFEDITIVAEKKKIVLSIVAEERTLTICLQNENNEERTIRLNQQHISELVNYLIHELPKPTSQQNQVRILIGCLVRKLAELDLLQREAVRKE